ncbi:MAG: fumarylacetoacetate hydrolase family protein [Acidobacteria bacterium]|nr:fumarylacetoacetate hydrolase family protein [Acidobacteriota bacterium]
MIESAHRIFRVEQAGGPAHVIESGGNWHRLDGELYGDYAAGARFDPAGLRLLAPVEPSKIVAVGLNYRDHAAEMNKPLPREPLIFLKPSTAVIGPGEAITLPPGVGRVDYESELGIVIGRRASHVAAADAAAYILGLTCVNDVTARELQRLDVQYTRAKGFDTFAPLGPAVAVGVDPKALDVQGWLNGERRQASNTRELIFDIGHLVKFVTSVMTLLPGDVISTGTPSGVGPLAAGDRIEIRIPGVGELKNEVVAGLSRSFAG